MHVAWGIDPATGRPRVAKGIVAVGPAAFGVIAVGFSAWGLFPCGLVAGGFGPVGLFAVGFWTVGLAAVGVQAVGLWALASWHAVGLVAVGPSPIGLERMVVEKGTVGLLFVVAIVAALFMDRLIRAIGSAPASANFGSSRREEAQTERGSGRVESDQRSRPRFARTAIVGLCFGILGILALVLYAVIGDSNLLDERLSNALAALGTLCLLITTILGWVAVPQIRRSARRLHGMWLAVFDGLLFPLLTLDGLLALQANTIVQTFSTMDAVVARNASQPASNARFDLLVWISTAFICVVSNMLVAWGVWRAVNKRSAAVLPAEAGNSSLGKCALGLFLAGTLGSLLLMTLLPRHQELAAAFGGVALALAMVPGLMRWRERLGKFVVIATSALLVAMIAVAAVLALVIVPAKRARLQAAFGPVTEWTLPMDEDGWAPLFDLDHNQPVFDPKPGDAAIGRVQRLQQLKEPGVAIRHDNQAHVIVFWGMAGTAVRPTRGGQWESLTDMDAVVTLWEDGLRMRPSESQTFNTPDNLPQAIFLKTGAGKLGLLQITGFTENPRGVKIRYKLILPQLANHPARLANVVHRNTDTGGSGSVKLVSATTARQGDLGVRLDCLGTVETSNSVSFAIPENYCQEVIRKFDAHQSLIVEADNHQGERFGHGLLVGVDNRIDTETGTLKCRASLIPEGGNLMVPGLFLNIHLLLEVKHGVILVPVDAILRDPQGTFVWAIKPDQTVSLRYVQTGTLGGAKVEIQSGLSPGEVVVTDGSYYLREGQKVYYKQVLPQRDDGK